MKLAAALLVLTSLVALADAPKGLLKPVNKTESWRLEEHEGGKGTLKIDGDNVVLASTKVTGSDWHVQAVMTGLDLKNGQDYILKFQAKAEASCQIGVNMGIDEEDWHTIGLGEQVTLGKTYDKYEFRFQASDVHTKMKNRLTFVVGFEPCQVTIKDLTLVAK